MMRLAILVLVAWLAVVFTARAEELAAGISRDKIEINSSFTGAEVVVFGAIESDTGAAMSDAGQRDVVVVIRSDKPSVATVRKKELMGPIWVNREARQFAGVPSYYFVASNKPLEQIAHPNVLKQFEIGLANIAMGPAPGSVGGPANFRTALLKSREGSELYGQHDGGVTFMSASLFRTTATLPPNVPAGNLRVSVYAFRNGQVISSNSMMLFIDKTGIERSLSDMAQNWPFLYGISAVLLAVLAGLLAATAFRERH
jgi:uncharacterized protein (TIGR02186 family)